MRPPTGARSSPSSETRSSGTPTYVALPGWQGHVGDAHLVISPAHRRRGLGALLAQSIIAAGGQLGVVKLVLEMVEEQSSGRQIFERLGFRQEGLLLDQARDQQGRLHNLLVLGYRLPDPPDA